MCDSDSGQCPCLRGISGLRCNHCQVIKPAHSNCVVTLFVLAGRVLES